MIGVEIYIEDNDLARCESVGKARRESSMKSNLRTRNHHSWRSPLAEWYDINGACGECAAGLVYGLPWEGRVDNYHDADLGEITQVRTTHWPNGCLILRTDDEVRYIYVLVIGHYPNRLFRVVGHIGGSRARSPMFRRDFRNALGFDIAWQVPQSALSAPSAQVVTPQNVFAADEIFHDST
jgi:hypothetical protein